jgi:hypothetical protein
MICNCIDISLEEDYKFRKPSLTGKHHFLGKYWKTTLYNEKTISYFSFFTNYIK